MTDRVEPGTKWVAMSSGKGVEEKGLKPTESGRRPAPSPPDPTPVNENK
jgi:hypothetical protein